MVAILTRRLEFPPATSANRDGLVAVGGDLSVERLLLAYRSGIFPWPISEEMPLTWFSPDPRAILELEALHVPRSLAKLMRRGTFRVTIDQAFPAVIQACGDPTPERPGTWITPDLLEGYIGLHEAGHAHSFETWLGDRLVGGLYGVAINGLFAGESMFSREDNASKIALVHLVEHLKARGYGLLDIQQGTRHMMSFGAKLISRKEYLTRLAAALRLPVTFS